MEPELTFLEKSAAIGQTWESGLTLYPRPQWRIRIADTFTIDSYEPRPNYWRRFWTWALLGWTWEEVPRG